LNATRNSGLELEPPARALGLEDVRQPKLDRHACAAWRIVVTSLLCAHCEVIGGYQTFKAQVEPAHPCDVLPKTKPNVGSMVLTKEHDDCFWVDRVETTVAQYGNFLKDDPWSALSGDQASCGWKSDFFDPKAAPEGGAGGEESEACFTLANREDNPFADAMPMRCVDWCEALAYCRWAEKKLCYSFVILGQTVGEPGGLWESACSAGSAYPYGTAVEPGRCNIGLTDGECGNAFGLGVCGPRPVSSTAPVSRCTSPNSGAVDMIGNVAEWSGVCGKIASSVKEETPNVKEETCQVKGGSFDDDETDVDCQTVTIFRQRQLRDHRIGFRCCAPLTDDEQTLVDNARRSSAD
jgi:formylglycine-generating enzyme required for sulfatase activity